MTTPPDNTLTLDNCEAVIIWLAPQRSVIVSRGGPKHVRPVEPGKATRQLQLGDRILYRGKPETVHFGR